MFCHAVLFQLGACQQRMKLQSRNDISDINAGLAHHWMSFTYDIIKSNSNRHIKLLAFWIVIFSTA